MSTREDIIAILRDTSVVTITALVEYVEGQRAEERKLIIQQIRSDAAVAEFGYGWHLVNPLRSGYQKGDRRKAGLSRLADWLEGRT